MIAHLETILQDLRSCFSRQAAFGVPFFWNDASNPSICLPLCPAWLSGFASRNQLQSGACGRHL